MAECEEELKNILMRVKEESEKASLKLNIQKLSIWHLVPLFHGKHEGKKNVMAKKEGKVEAATDFIFLGSKITVDSDCSHEIQRCLLLGRKAVANLDSILKNRDITLPMIVHIVRAMFFPVSHVWM